MALLYRAELRPSKLDLLTAWLPTRPWFAGTAGADVTRVAAYRFDDPAGEVGIETLLVRAGDGPILQVPLTYRGAPLAGADQWLVGTTEHSVLGPRWVYDACADPVYPPVLAAAVLAGAGQAEEYFEVDGRREVRPRNMTVTGGHAGAVEPPAVGAPREVVDGDPTLIRADHVELAVVRRPALGQPSSDACLTGTWPGQTTPLALAYAVPR
ncbi:CG0192-related protein [Micromonospora sp. SL1-18]|uniref:CG0192-related protein n=1 Tax=Micromonospora sp. SL1-18 TaxID=3399128 RepID=UPI003A4DC69C